MPRVDGVARTRNAGARQLRIRRRERREDEKEEAPFAEDAQRAGCRRRGEEAPAPERAERKTCETENHKSSASIGKQPSADLESEFRDAADETTSLLHRPRSRFDTGQFSFRDAAQ